MFILFMGISVHVYDTIDEYVLRNKHTVSPKLEVNETSLPLQDIWITKDEKIMVVLDCEKYFEKILRKFTITNI